MMPSPYSAMAWSGGAFGLHGRGDLGQREVDVEVHGGVRGRLLLDPSEQPGLLQVAAVLVGGRVREVERLLRLGDGEPLVVRGEREDVELPVVGELLPDVLEALP